MIYMLERDKQNYYDIPTEVRAAFEQALANCYNNYINHFNIYFLGAFSWALTRYRDEVYEVLELIDGNGFTVNYDVRGVEVTFDFERLEKAIIKERSNK